ncbi:MAG: YncE family protein [Edaphobacter sp.]|uniref:YncE family protein n=1 Tax=Edaphobacter sp. TaxID=1934404 RepID=UPI00239B36DB|nr:YncE family protein [Edaphobacter sp.]MDE1177349.1 YncE family protein [Edaphobacter sp.]
MPTAFHRLRALGPALLPFALLPVFTGCRRNGFPDVPAGYHEYAYVTNGASNTVTVLDLVALRPDRTLRVGDQPTGIAVNPRRNEVYAVNTRSGSVTVIDATTNSVAATIGVHRQPYFITVDAQGGRAYVANSGSNSVSVIDLDARREIAVVGTGEQPGMARIAPDMRSLVVSNRRSGSVSVYSVAPYISTYRGPGGGSPEAPAPTAPARPTESEGPALKFRAAFPGCPGATDVQILPDSSKAFVACSSGHQVMAISLSQSPDSWAAKQNPNALTDHLLTMLDVGNTPVHLAMKPDGGEIFTSNFSDDSISELSTWTNEVGGTYTIGSKPTHGIVSHDNSTLWVANFGADLVSIYSIDDGRLVTTIHTGSAPDALAFSADEHLLLVADAHSGDVSVIRTQGRQGAALFTMLPAGGSPNDIAVKSYTVR